MNKMKKIGIKYIADETRVYKVRQVHGRFELNERLRELGFRVSDADNSSGVEKSVFGLSVLSDEAYLGENLRENK